MWMKMIVLYYNLLIKKTSPIPFQRTNHRGVLEAYGKSKV
jgi:hypothetical protein